MGSHLRRKSTALVYCMRSGNLLATFPGLKGELDGRALFSVKDRGLSYVSLTQSPLTLHEIKFPDCRFLDSWPDVVAFAKETDRCEVVLFSLSGGYAARTRAPHPVLRTCASHSNAFFYAAGANGSAEAQLCAVILDLCAPASPLHAPFVASRVLGEWGWTYMQMSAPLGSNEHGPLASDLSRMYRVG